MARVYALRRNAYLLWIDVGNILGLVDVYAVQRDVHLPARVTVSHQVPLALRQDVPCSDVRLADRRATAAAQARHAEGD